VRRSRSRQHCDTHGRASSLPLSLSLSLLLVSGCHGFLSLSLPRVQCQAGPSTSFGAPAARASQHTGRPLLPKPHRRGRHRRGDRGRARSPSPFPSASLGLSLSLSLCVVCPPSLGGGPAPVWSGLGPQVTLMSTTSNAEAQAAQGGPLAGQLRSELFLSADHIDCISPDLLEAAPSFLTAWAKTSTTTGYFVLPTGFSLSLSLLLWARMLLLLAAAVCAIPHDTARHQPPPHRQTDRQTTATTEHRPSREEGCVVCCASAAERGLLLWLSPHRGWFGCRPATVSRRVGAWWRPGDEPGRGGFGSVWGPLPQGPARPVRGDPHPLLIDITAPDFRLPIGPAGTPYGAPRCDAG
jgi:hypothetical protein